MYLPGRPVVVDVCVTHPLASSAVVAAAWGTGVSVKANDALKRDTYGHAGTAPVPNTACVGSVCVGAGAASSPCPVKHMAELAPSLCASP